MDNINCEWMFYEPNECVYCLAITIVVVARNVRKRGRKKMTELERISKNLEETVNSMRKKGIQSKKVSLTLISQSLISIAEELAIMNDRAAERKE